MLVVVNDFPTKYLGCLWMKGRILSVGKLSVGKLSGQITFRQIIFRQNILLVCNACCCEWLSNKISWLFVNERKNIICRKVICRKVIWTDNFPTDNIPTKYLAGLQCLFVAGCLLLWMERYSLSKNNRKWKYLSVCQCHWLLLVNQIKLASHMNSLYDLQSLSLLSCCGSKAWFLLPNEFPTGKIEWACINQTGSYTGIVWMHHGDNLINKKWMQLVQKHHIEAKLNIFNHKHKTGKRNKSGLM